LEGDLASLAIITRRLMYISSEYKETLMLLTSRLHRPHFTKIEEFIVCPSNEKSRMHRTAFLSPILDWATAQSQQINPIVMRSLLHIFSKDFEFLSWNATKFELQMTTTLSTLKFSEVVLLKSLFLANLQLRSWLSRSTAAIYLC
jgi:hypothetical protein